MEPRSSWERLLRNERVASISLRSACDVTAIWSTSSGAESVIRSGARPSSAAMRATKRSSSRLNSWAPRLLVA